MNGKRILVTGVSSGLGQAIVEALLVKGALVDGIARSESEKYAEWAKRFPEQFRFVKIDLAKTEEIEPSINEAFTMDHCWDGLVNNAGVAYDDLITNLKFKPLQQLFEVNVYAPMVLSRVFIRRALFHRRAGSIVHVSSICTSTPFKGLAMYAASKGALEAFSLSLAKEWERAGIRSICIAPGFMETRMTSSLTDEQREKIRNRGGESDMQAVVKETLDLLDL